MITNQEYLYSIRKCYLFDGINDEQLPEAIKLLNGRIKKVEKDDFYDQITMHTFTGGYLFGEALVINDAKNSPVQVRAVEDCIILFVDLAAIYQSDVHSPILVVLAENLIKSLARKNLILNQKVRILSQKSLRDRILIYLGTLPKDKNGFVKIPFTQTALAEYLGVNRSAPYPVNSAGCRMRNCLL